MSWVALDDAIYAIHHAIFDGELAGPMNVVAPGAVSNADFTRTLAGVLERPAFMTVPAFAVKLAFGEMGESAVLGGVLVRPARLTARGFRFAFPDLESALRHVLGHAS
jgi:NAD dependent epimerase/dehydratase family enzyme